MRGLIETTFVSLDGVIESAAKWSLPLWSDEQKAYVNNELADYGAFLLGRVTYEEFAATSASAAAGSHLHSQFVQDLHDADV
jgi:hypothetical protein